MVVPGSFSKNNEMQPQHKYARIERERRFLLDQFRRVDVVKRRVIQDRYLDGTSLRLREQTDDGGLTVFKLTQKIPPRGSGAQQGFITTIYLEEGEFRLLTQLPAKTISKIRYSVPPFGIDVFEGALQGLRLAEVEFHSAADADALILPNFILREVTGDERFTGGQLVCASKPHVERWLAEYGLVMPQR
jgi:CYTH domain-containing protein